MLVIYLVKVIYYSFLLPPGIFIVAFVLLGFLSRKKQKGLTAISMVFAILLYAMSIDVVGDLLIHDLEYKYTPPLEYSGDVLIMLGGGGVDKSPNVGFQGHLGSDASNRLITIFSLYQKTGYPIILSGGTLFGLSDTEANIGKNILMSVGVPKEKIFLEDKSSNTEQNAKYSAEIINANGFKKPILVTSAFHMPRAVREFEGNNMKVVPFPAGYRTTGETKVNILTLLPASNNLDKTALAIKEYIGILKLKIFG